jgi:hypothetical protein
MDCHSRCLELDERSWKTLYNMEIICLKIEKYDQAAECFNRSLQINPEHMKGHYSLGKVHYLVGKYREAPLLPEGRKADPGLRPYPLQFGDHLCEEDEVRHRNAVHQEGHQAITFERDVLPELQSCGPLHGSSFSAYEGGDQVLETGAGEASRVRIRERINRGSPQAQEGDGEIQMIVCKVGVYVLISAIEHINE